jgi:hypothetical protein
VKCYLNVRVVMAAVEGEAAGGNPRGAYALIVNRHVPSLPTRYVIHAHCACVQLEGRLEEAAREDAGLREDAAAGAVYRIFHVSVPTLYTKCIVHMCSTTIFCRQSLVGPPYSDYNSNVCWGRALQCGHSCRRCRPRWWRHRRRRRCSTNNFAYRKTVA